MLSPNELRPLTCHAFIATSLDGFIARKNGSIDWLEMANSSLPPGEDCGFRKFFSQVDCLILGRVTFETVLSFPHWPYGETPAIIMTHRGLQIPDPLKEKVEVSSEPLNVLVKRLNARGFKKAYIDGGMLIQSFLKEKLLTQITITRIPVLLGEGVPLFGDLGRDIHLKLIESKSWPFSFVQDHYEIL